MKGRGGSVELSWPDHRHRECDVLEMRGDKLEYQFLLTYRCPQQAQSPIKQRQRKQRKPPWQTQSRSPLNYCSE